MTMPDEITLKEVATGVAHRYTRAPEWVRVSEATNWGSEMICGWHCLNKRKEYGCADFFSGHPDVYPLVMRLDFINQPEDAT